MTVTNPRAFCTGISASWCPVCGDCTCERATDGDCCFDGRDCPLHGHASKHAETVSREEVSGRIATLAQELDVELSEDDQAGLARFTQLLFERSKKVKAS